MKVELTEELVSRLLGYAEQWNPELGDYGYTSPEEYAIDRMKRDLISDDCDCYDNAMSCRQIASVLMDNINSRVTFLNPETNAQYSITEVVTTDDSTVLLTGIEQ